MQYPAERVRTVLSRLDPDLMASYNGYFLKRASPSDWWDTRVILDKVAPQLGSEDPLLDVGCSVGTWLLYLWFSGFRVLYGSDHDARKICIAGELAASFDADICFMCQSLIPENCPAAFKLVTALQFLYEKATKADPHTFLTRVKEILLPGGIVVFDWFVEETPPKRRFYLTVAELLAQVPQGFECIQMVPHKTANGHTVLYALQLQHEV